MREMLAEGRRHIHEIVNGKERARMVALYDAVDSGATLAELAARFRAKHRSDVYLTRREQEVLKHTLAGATSKRASKALGISARTVEFHRANIMRKCGVNRFAALREFARRKIQ
jgi:DNA-binding CsgD family transcriptional regulator